LPDGADATRPPADGLAVIVPLTGPVVIDGESISSDQLDMRLAAARDRTAAVTIVEDGQVPLTRITALMHAADRAGFTSVAIATRPRPGSGDPVQPDSSGERAP
ncbi:MAG: biopolymer transporter ExbD, partial [Myxococcota bacterium]